MIDGLHLIDGLFAGHPARRLLALQFAHKCLQLVTICAPEGFAALASARLHIGPDWTSRVQLLVFCLAGGFLGDGDVVVHYHVSVIRVQERRTHDEASWRCRIVSLPSRSRLRSAAIPRPGALLRQSSFERCRCTPDCARIGLVDL